MKAKTKLNFKIPGSLKRYIYGQYTKESKIFKGSVTFAEYVRRELPKFEKANDCYNFTK